MPIRIALFAVIVAACAPAASPPAPAVAPRVEPPPPLTFGMSMPLGVEASRDAGTLVGNYLTDALKRPVQVRLFNYADLVDAMADGQVDIAALTPLTYVRTAKRVDVTIVRKAIYHGVTTYVSVLFVRKDSPFTKLQDLEHKKVAWVQKGSASGNLVPRALLLQRDMDPDKFFSEERYLQDHGKVCQAVWDGAVDVGASFADVLPSNARPEDQPLVEGCRAALGDEKVKDLRIITWGDALPNDVVIARNGLSPEIVNRLGAALDNLPATPEGVRVLHDGFHADAFTTGSEADFTALRALMLKFPDEG